MFRRALFGRALLTRALIGRALFRRKFKIVVNEGEYRRLKKNTIFIKKGVVN